jgi:hypothetical protein
MEDIDFSADGMQTAVDEEKLELTKKGSKAR